MKSPLGFGIAAIAATASLAWGGTQDPKDTKDPKDAKDLKVTGAPGKGITFASGDEFQLNLLNYVQPRFTYESNDSSNPASNGGDDNVATFDIARARTILSGHLYNKDIQYKLQMEWNEGIPIKDAWLQWMFWHKDNNGMGLRFGQTKTYFGREATGTSRQLEFVNRAISTRTFANSRSRGAMVLGNHVDNKLRWTAGVFNSDTAAASISAGEEAGNPDNELNYVFSLRFDGNGSMGDESYAQADLDNSETLLWSVGGGLQIANNRAVVAGATRDVDGTSININGAMRYRGWHALAEVFLRSDDPDVAASVETDSTGFQIGGSYTLAAQDGKHSQWGFGGRFSFMDLDDAGQVMLIGTPLATAKGEVSEITLGVSNYYRKHNLKTQINYTLQNVEPNGVPDATNHIFEVQVTFVF